jgi:hypothetical protein
MMPSEEAICLLRLFSGGKRNFLVPNDVERDDKGRIISKLFIGSGFHIEKS